MHSSHHEVEGREQTHQAGNEPIVIKVMKGMLPKNRLGRRLIENMHVYNGSEHPHAAQNPKVIDINKLK